VGRGSAPAPARPRTRGRSPPAGEAPVGRPGGAAAHPPTHGRRIRTAEAPERPGGRERCPRAGRAGVGRRAGGLEGLHAPGRDPRSGARRARTAPGRQSRARHRRPDAIRAARRGEGAQPRFPCPANPLRRPAREQSPPGPSTLAHPRLHRPPRRRTSSPAQTTRAPVPVRQTAKADRLEASGAARRRAHDRRRSGGRGRRRIGDQQKTEAGPRQGADRWPAAGQVASQPVAPGRWGSSPAMPTPRWEPLAPLPRRKARRPGPAHPWVALDPPQRSPLGLDRPRWPHPSRQSAPEPHRPFPPVTLRPRPPGRARHQPREPGREHPSDPGPARPLQPTQVPGPGQALGQQPRAPRAGAYPARQQGEGPAASPRPDPHRAAPTRGVRRVLGDLARDARAGGRGRSFGPRKLPRAAPGRASGPAYRGWRASATALVHNPRDGPIPPAAFEG